MRRRRSSGVSFPLQSSCGDLVTLNTEHATASQPAVCRIQESSIKRKKRDKKRDKKKKKNTKKQNNNKKNKKNKLKQI